MIDGEQKSQGFLSVNNFILLNVDHQLNWLRSHAEALYNSIQYFLFLVI